MNNSIRLELQKHILECINDGLINNDNIDDLHYHCFNEDYYLIGYYNCSEWLRKHNIGELEGAGICQEYEIDNFGQSQVYDNSEKVVNMLAYIYGEQIISSMDFETVENLIEELN